MSRVPTQLGSWKCYGNFRKQPVHHSTLTKSLNGNTNKNGRMPSEMMATQLFESNAALSSRQQQQQQSKSRRHLLNTPTETEQELIGALIASIPFVGEIAGFLVGLLWPPGPSVWEQIEDQVNNLVDNAVFSRHVRDLINMLDVSKTMLLEYRAAANKDIELEDLLSEMVRIYNSLDLELN